MPRSHVLGLAATLSHEMQTHASLLQGVLTPSERKLILAFVAAPQDQCAAGTHVSLQPSKSNGLAGRQPNTQRSPETRGARQEVAYRRQGYLPESCGSELGVLYATSLLPERDRPKCGRIRPNVFKAWRTHNAARLRPTRGRLRPYLRWFPPSLARL